eukprot:CAMPEP_0201595002 /NCGR_PEP_ID=MMETSP0190_2-20130828/192145_1 /ASSEMBLY_ACC=CAM_ASM_000263 /TAXON_ID=37353 /ORGANISM="Rosalina sp." /LENGTH=270 /DNA_ID=CAMNT_0048054829 /DNA_START=1269 /DNA_END=2081 /DNA_ORIENTATION=+
MMMFEKKKKSIRKKADTITSTIPYIMDIQEMVFKEIMNRINGMDKYQQPGIEHENANDDHKDSEDEHDELEESGFSSDLFINPDDSDSDAHSDNGHGNGHKDERRPLLQDRDDGDMIDTLSLKQLYFIKNKLNDCFMKHDILTKSLNKLNECVNYKVNDRECEWEGWSADDIVEWILQLENGRFKPYEDTLRQELNDGDATGAILPHLDISDWRKSFSIKNWKDATDLNRYKNILVTNKKEEVDVNEENIMAVHEYPSPFDPAEEGADTK